MLVENMSDLTRRLLFNEFIEMTQAALVKIFQKSDQEANLLVTDLRSRFEDAPQREMDLLLHNDPVALACDLAEAHWAEVDQIRLQNFTQTRLNAVRRAQSYLR